MSSYQVISSDSHVVEPEDLWTTRVEPMFRERAPRIVRDEGGFDYWYCDGRKLMAAGIGGQVGKRFDEPETLTIDSVYEEARPGGYIPEEHIKDLDTDGVDVSMVYPTVGLVLYGVPDSDLLTEIFRAYNDWLAEFCKPFPNRLKGIAMINVDDVQSGVKELERCSKMGLAGGMITVYPP